jgi:16S rRNA (cytidine1402-2'-O)-methyltransferase
MEMDKHDPLNNIPIIKEIFADHDEVGLMSEAGCPGVADPGRMFVRQAHHQGIKVIPLTGPSSILLALMASGMNGQSFQFQGYLSPKKDQLRKDILSLEKTAQQQQSAQIFIETPYRNRAMIELLLSTLHPDTLLCIAANITAPTEYIQTHTIQQWKNTQLPDLHKIPCIFLIGTR